jgi:hypothetical protein
MCAGIPCAPDCAIRLARAASLFVCARGLIGAYGHGLERGGES